MSASLAHVLRRQSMGRYASPTSLLRNCTKAPLTAQSTLRFTNRISPFPIRHHHTEHHGSCHCKDVTVTFKTSKTPKELGVRQCQCAYCKLNGSSHTSDPNGTLTVKTAPGGKINPYRFGSGTAEWLLCAKCGIYPAITWKREDGKTLGVVHVQTLETRDELLKHEGPMHVNEEPWEDRFARRSRTWTPVVVEE